MPHGEHDLESAFEKAFADEGVQLPKDVRQALSVGLVKAVEIAAQRAAATLDVVRIKRAVRRSALLTAVVVAGISIPVTYVISNEGRRRNCRLITSIAKVQRDRIVENKAATERFKAESIDRLGLSPKRFDELIREGEVKEAHQLAVYGGVARASC